MLWFNLFHFFTGSSKENDVAAQIAAANMMNPFGAGFLPGLDPSMLPYMGFPGMPGFLPGMGMPFMPPGFMPGQCQVQEKEKKRKLPEVEMIENLPQQKRMCLEIIGSLPKQKRMCVK